MFLPPCRVIALWAWAPERRICGLSEFFSCTDSFWCSAHKPKEFSINYKNTRAKINSNSRLSLTLIHVSWNKQLLMHSWSSDNARTGFPVILSTNYKYSISKEDYFFLLSLVTTHSQLPHLNSYIFRVFCIWQHWLHRVKSRVFPLLVRPYWLLKGNWKPKYCSSKYRQITETDTADAWLVTFHYYKASNGTGR